MTDAVTGAQGQSDDCSCADPTQFLEGNCPVHAAEVVRILEAQAAEHPPPEVETTPLPPALRRDALINLTPAAEAAARLEAWGVPRKDIAAQVGVTPRTVANWRRDPVYIERRRVEIDLVLADARNRMAVDKQAAFEGRAFARGRLLELAEATDPDGRPLMGVQIEALKVLMADKAATSEYGDGGSKVDVKVQVGAVLHVYDDDTHEEPPPTAVVIDGEFTEVEDV